MLKDLPKKEDNIESNPQVAETTSSNPESEVKEEVDNKKEEELTAGGDVVVERVRTYQDAIQEALRSQSMSSAKVLMAEQRRREDRKIDDENTSLKTPRNKVFVGAAIGLAVIAVAVLFATILTKSDTDPLSGPKSVLSSVFFDPDGVIEVASAPLSRNTILKLQQVISSPFAKNSVQQIILTKEVIADPTSSLRLTKTVAYETEDMLALIEARAPDSLRRSLDKNFFLGVTSTNTNEPFLIFKINNFDNVFAGMFQWENTLVKDMTPVFFKNLSVLNQPITNPIPEPIIVGTSSTSTILELPPKTTFNTRNLEDKVIGNTDARVLKNQSGDTIFFYTYIDEEYLFFGTNEKTFLDIRKAIRSSRLVL